MTEPMNAEAVAQMVTGLRNTFTDILPEECADKLEALAAENATLRAERDDYREAYEDTKRLARMIDIAMHGEEGAANEAAGEVAAHGCSEISFFVRRAIRALITAPQRDALQAAIDAAKAEARAEDAVKIERVQHVKRGSTYRVIGAAKLQTDRPLSDYAELTVYQCETDGMIWARPVDEFEDGRFAQIGAKP